MAELYCPIKSPLHFLSRTQDSATHLSALVNLLLVFHNDDELSSWNACASSRHAYASSTSRNARNATAPTWHAALYGISAGFDVAYAPGSARAEVAKVGADAEQALRGEVKGWIH